MTPDFRTIIVLSPTSYFERKDQGVIETHQVRSHPYSTWHGPNERT